jgi:hypothetical protein
MGKLVKTLCTDRGGEQTGNRANCFLEEQGTGHLPKSCKIMFDEGGMKLCYEHTILKHNSTNAIPSQLPDALPLIFHLSLTSVHPPTPPACPKHTTCMLIHNDNPWYTITSHMQQSCTAVEAMSHHNTTKWDAACEDKTVPWPQNHKVIGSEWVPWVKYKMCTIVQGSTQVKPLDYKDMAFLTQGYL